MEPVPTPWRKSYHEIPYYLEYETGSMYDVVRRTAETYPHTPAYSFMGRAQSYAELMDNIEKAARAFYMQGVRPGQHVLLCLPNMPQTVDCLYALNLLGAVAVVVHPLSSVGEIEHFLHITKSERIVVLDQFAQKFVEAQKNTWPLHLIIADVRDALDPLKSFGYWLIAARKIQQLPSSAHVVHWKDFLFSGDACKAGYRYAGKADDPAVILFSGGTTGVTKGALLSNRNINALAIQTVIAGHADKPGSAMLAILPMFHGFGLGVGVHTALANGGQSMLIPTVSAKEYVRILRKYKPNYIAGVPTLYESILNNPGMRGVDLSYLLGVYSGGDSMSPELHRRFNAFLDEHHAPVHVQEGYGMTECVSASCLTPRHIEREGSIGLPHPDTYYQIVTPDTEERLPYGEPGEICISGPSVMLGYVDQPEETARVLRTHADGRIWLHTGDMGWMDEDGFVYYKQRIKRMIVNSGYSIYPSQIEQVLEEHEAVQLSCVIGLPDEYRGQRIKAFIMLRPGFTPSETLKDEILQHCRKGVAQYAMPEMLEFREELPLTLVGKVAYRVLEEEEAAKATPPHSST